MLSIKVPPLGESIVEATVGRWMKKEGDPVAAGDTLVELETDKITVEVPAPKAGVLMRRSRAEGDTVKVDDLLAEIDETAAGAVAVGASRETPAAGSPPVATATPTTPEPRVDVPKTSPSVRRMSAEEEMSPADVEGTGRGGRVTKADMVDAVEWRGAAATIPSTAPIDDAGRGPPPENQNTAKTSDERQPSTAAPITPTPTPEATQPQPDARPPAPASAGQRETREKMSTRRKRIAEHLLEAQHATAHLTTFNEADMSAVMALRDRMKDKVEKAHGVKLTYMPFFIKAACMALKSQPSVNAQVDGDSILYRRYVNMGVAVASDQGLVVPVIKDADSKGMVELSGEIAAVAKRARDGKLTMDDLTGGTFTITNGGVFGSLVSTPILNYPQSGILGLHKIQDRPIAVSGKVEIRPMMYLALSYDHRIVEGQQAVLFLVRVKELMEDPAAMLID